MNTGGRGLGWVIAAITTQVPAMALNGFLAFWLFLESAATDCRFPEGHEAFCRSHPFQLLVGALAMGAASLALAALTALAPARLRALKTAGLTCSVVLSLVTALLLLHHPTA
jgi:hypothetical protein